MRLLIAEDDPALGGYLRKALAQEASTVEIAADGGAAVESFVRDKPDLLILDLDLPVRSGMEVLAVVRELSPLCPVLILSGRAVAEARVACLDLGADDCMAKPFSLSELRARCRALLRRRRAPDEHFAEHSGSGAAAFSSPKAAGSPIHPADSTSPANPNPVLGMGALTLDRLRKQVSVDGQDVHLTNREYALLEQLLLAADAAPGATLSRASLRERIWGGQTVHANGIDVHMAALRRKLALAGAAPAIQSVRGSGYRLMGRDPNEAHSRQRAGAIPAD